MTKFDMTEDFSKDLEKYQKKYLTIRDDLNTFADALDAELPDILPGTYRISNLGEEITHPFYKVKKFRSQSFPTRGVNSGFRIIYTYLIDEDRIILIELYHKNKKENEDRDRIIRVFKEISAAS